MGESDRKHIFDGVIKMDESFFSKATEDSGRGQ
jgi:hypothetical protein